MAQREDEGITLEMLAAGRQRNVLMEKSQDDMKATTANTLTILSNVREELEECEAVSLSSEMPTRQAAHGFFSWMYTFQNRNDKHEVTWRLKWVGVSSTLQRADSSFQRGGGLTVRKTIATLRP